MHINTYTALFTRAYLHLGNGSNTSVAGIKFETKFALLPPACLYIYILVSLLFERLSRAAPLARLRSGWCNQESLITIPKALRRALARV